MNNLTFDSKRSNKVNESEKATKKSKSLNLSATKKKVDALALEVQKIYSEFPKNEIYNIITYLADIKREIKKIENENI